MLSQLFTLLGKDLLLQYRTRETAFLIFVFSLLVVLVFCFVFGPIFAPLSLTAEEQQKERSKLAAGVLWAAFSFSGVIGLNRSFDIERTSGALKGIKITGVEPGILYFSKVLGNLIFLFVIEILVTPITLIFFAVLDFLTFEILVKLALLVMLGTFGFCTLGTLLSAISTSTRGKESLLSVILFPLLFPLIISASKCTAMLFGREPLRSENWLTILVVFSLVFFAASYILFEYVVEE